MFGRTSASKKIIAVADIGSASAGVAIVAVNEKGPAIIIASDRAAIPFENRSASATITAVLASLDDAGQKALARFAASPYKGSVISGAYAVIDAPWSRSQTVRAASSFEKDIRVTSAMIGDAAQRAIGSDTAVDMNNLIESTVVRVELNGYPTGSPVGKTAHRLSVAALLSECDASIRSGAAESLARLFPGTKQTLRSGSRALIAAMSAVPDLGNDYVILAVVAEASNVLVVRDGLVVQHAQIGEGVRSIVSRVADKGMPEETLSLLRMVERDECSGDACDMITQSMARVEIELARVYGEALTKIATPTRLPADLVLVTHSDMAPWLTTFFSRIDFTQCTLIARPFSVHALGRDELSHLVEFDQAAPADIELLIAGALVNTEEQ
jgi:hypothetical protein